MTIKLSISHYDNQNRWLYGETDNGDTYVFIDEWHEEKRTYYPVLYTCTRNGLPYIPLYDENYEISVDLTIHGINLLSNVFQVHMQYILQFLNSYKISLANNWIYK